MFSCWIAAIVASVTARVVAAPPRSVVCSDGLWNYFDQPPQLAQLAAETAGSTPLAIARRLVQGALDSGGHDNITVAVIAVEPHVVGTETASPALIEE